MRFSRRILFVIYPLVFGCGGNAIPAHEWGQFSRLSTVEGDFEMCEHEVPSEVCVLCHPELEPEFRAVNDWCPPHHVPESQCHRCHPDLTFAPLPELRETADYRELTDQQVMEGLATWAVPGKVTIFDFYATWCAPCQNLEVRLFELANANPEVAVRKITITGWEGPVVDRYLSHVAGLPHLRVFDPAGNEAAELTGDEIDTLDEVVQRALSQR